MVSGVAIASNGKIYEVQRGPKSAPVLVLDAHGHVLRSWGELGAGQYTVPHSIRLDPEGNVWTVDAATSRIVKYSPSGRRLMSIDVGGQPDNGSVFDGTTDIAFGPVGRIFIADGYGNARVLEYTRAGKKVGEWGRRGAGPGEMNLPHSVQIEAGTLYVADRENGRIEEFDLTGHYVGQIPNLGRVYSIKVSGGVIWASMGPFDREPGAAGGWVLKLDRRSGRILGHIDIAEPGAGHALDVTPSGEPVITQGDGLLWFRADR